MAMRKPNGAEGIQRQYCYSQKEQVPCGRFCGTRKIFTKVSIQSIQNGVRVTDKIPEMLIKWAFPGLLYAC